MIVLWLASGTELRIVDFIAYHNQSCHFQVIGRNCRFLQGPGTDPRSIEVIRKAIANGTEVTTCILNYKVDGTPFWNQFFIAPLRDSDKCIVNYVSIKFAYIMFPCHFENDL